MDLEKLDKSQIVLLTLLVSFMTSIATGIVTVSLMQQAPPAITETVNRVVERTVERVVPSQTAAVAAPQPTKTIYLKESEAIPQAVETIAPSIVRIFAVSGEETTFIGLGVVIDGTGKIVTDASVLSDSSAVLIELPGSMQVPGSVTSRDTSLGVAYIEGATSTDKGPISWKASRISSDKLSLGQTVVALSGRTGTRIAQGIVTSITPPVADASQSAVLETDIQKDVIIPGSPIIDTSGTLLGVSTGKSRASSASGFTPLMGASVTKETNSTTQ